MLAQALIDQPRMCNHHRGLWGYTGEAFDGKPLTIQSTGMGGPSAAIVLEELQRLGVRRAIRIGTARSLTGEAALGSRLVATEALAGDGTSRSLGADGRVAPSPELTEALLEACDGRADRATVASHDVLYEPDPDGARARWVADGAVACDLETAAVFQVALRTGVQAACALTVVAAGDGQLEDTDLRDVSELLARAAVTALGRG
jgi:uridine phosphorylase